MPVTRAPILVVEDDEALRRQLRWLLEGEHDLELTADREAALKALRGSPYAAVLLDLHLTADGRDGHGLDVLRWISRFSPATRVILLTGESDPDLARETLRWGAWDFFPKPVDPDDLRRALRRALRLREIEDAGGGSEAGLERFGDLSTRNAELAQVLRAARALAATPLPILILGPPGCGKTRLAQEILAAGGDSRVLRAEAGTLPPAETRLEGAAWLLEQVEDLPAAKQEDLAALLADEDGSRQRGRVLATARRDLLELARRRRFLPDLARRLETTRLEIPPLAVRPEDLSLVACACLSHWAQERDRPMPRLTPEVEADLSRWTAGMEVREVEMVLRGAAERAQGLWIAREHFLPERPARRESLRTQRARLEASLVSEALARCAGNVTRTARELGVSRPTLHDLMRKYALDPSRFRRS